MKHMKKMIALIIGILLAACTRYDDPPPEQAPPIPDYILAADSTFKEYGDTVVPAGLEKSGGIFWFDHYTSVPYPGDTAHIGENDLLDFWQYVEVPIFKKIYKDVFSTMQNHGAFMQWYNIGLRSHFKQLPDTSFSLYFEMDYIQQNRFW
jgi:hypothetical protein